MMACFRKVMVFVCLINLLLILCISFVTGDEVDDDDSPLPDLKVKRDIIVNTEGGMEDYEHRLDGAYDALVGIMFTINFTVENVGAADAKNVTVNFKMVYHNAANEEFIEYEDNSIILNIKAGTNTTLEFDWTPQQYATAYTVVLTIDPNDDIPEEVEWLDNKLNQRLFHTAPNLEESDEDSGKTFFNNVSLKSCIPIGLIILVTCSVIIIIMHIVKEDKAVK